jgi:hypothetical protein
MLSDEIESDVADLKLTLNSATENFGNWEKGLILTLSKLNSPLVY